MGVCFNPVTAQVAALREQDARIYHLADTKEKVELKGKFTGAACWSGNGRFLVLAKQGSGIDVYENTLIPAEQKIAADWWKKLEVKPLISRTASTATVQALEALRRFALTEPDRGDLAKRLAKAAASGRTEKPAAWQDCAPYAKDAEVLQAIQSARMQLRNKEDIGIAVFQLRKALKDHADFVPGQFYLAEALQQSDQAEEAEKLYVSVVQGDAGRTELSVLALDNLATLLAAKQRELTALDCLAEALALDRANPRTAALAMPLLRKQHFEAVADQLSKLTSSVTPALADRELPTLPGPTEAKTYTPAELYRKAVWSVVLIKTNLGSGSGVCIGRPDIIVTNHHVVADAESIEVFPFILKDNAAMRMPAVRAKVILRTPKRDLAVLKLEEAPSHLQTLFVAEGNPSAGEKVFAIGSPGLGTDTLDQSISEGLISSTNRIIDGQPYLQHSAAVNPGNSGGALLDEKCRLIGIVTLKAQLENVGFAIPAETLRLAFKSP